jgi:hypothetical protein
MVCFGSTVNVSVPSCQVGGYQEQEQHTHSQNAHLAPPEELVPHTGRPSTVDHAL